MSDQLAKGRCQCGAVEYSVCGEVEAFYCHCEDCRLNSGAPFVAWGRVQSDVFTLHQGTLKTFSSSDGVFWSFCEECGTSIKYVNVETEPEVDFFLATLEAGADVEPAFHVQVKEKLPWVNIADDLPQYQRWRRGGD